MSQNVAKLSRYIMKSPVPLRFWTPCTQLHFYAAKTRKSRLNTNSNFTRLQQNIKYQIRRQFFSLFLGFTLSKLFCACRFCFLLSIQINIQHSWGACWTDECVKLKDMINWGVCWTEKRVELKGFWVPYSSTLHFHTRGPLLFCPKTTQFNTTLSCTQKPLSPTPKTPRFNTENPWVPHIPQFHTKNPSVQHQKPFSSTHPLVPHKKPLSSTLKSPQFDTKNLSVPHTPQFHTKNFLVLQNTSLQHTPQFYTAYIELFSEECLDLRGFCVGLMRVWNCGVLVWNWGGGWTEGFLVWNWGISGAEKVWSLCGTDVLN